MDDFVSSVVIWVVCIVVVAVVSWGAIFYLFMKFVGKNPKLSSQQKWMAAAGILKLLGGGSGSSTHEPGPVESSVRGAAARNGIDLDK